MGPSVVLIGRLEQVAGFRKRLGHEPSIAVFSDAEALKALEVILARPPRLLALDRPFVVTSRGAALVARLRADPQMQGIEIRVLAEDETHLPIILNTRTPGLEGTVLKTSHPLDYCGTRRAPRFPVTDDVKLVVNGERGLLVNLSSTGAQLLVALRLRPAEPLRLALICADSELRLRAIVAWSVAESSGGILSYRAGVEFTNPDSLTLDAFCQRHTAVDSAIAGPQP